jgi:hypothetical protein
MKTYIPSALRRQVHKMDEGNCAYCRTPERLTVVTFEIDHITPTSTGGASTLENLCLSCPTCNRFKSTFQSALDPETGQTVSLFHPRQQDWVKHFTWSEDGARIIGLTATGRATVEALKLNRPRMARLRRLWLRIGEHPQQTRAAQED